MSEVFVALVIAMLTFGFISFLIILYLASIEGRLIDLKAEIDARKETKDELEK